MAIDGKSLKRRRPKNRTLRLYGEHPIKRIVEDKLGRSSFAKAISQAISAWKGETSLVVALYGNWGDGKSSVKGMALDDLKRKKHSPTIVEFNPWEWAGNSQLASAFFEEIGKQIGEGQSNPEARAAASRLRGLGKVVALARPLWSAFRGLIAQADPDAALIGDAAIAASDRIKDVSDAAADAEAEASHPKSLPKIKVELETAFRKLKEPILVVVDDIDRLSADEIKLLFQLIKANSDLPNMVFFLLFQRDVVEAALEKTVGTGTGKAYLEKIVQVGIDLPKVPQTVLGEFLRERLSELLADFGLADKMDWNRWDRYYGDALAPYFQNLRDIYRCLSTYEFHLGLFSGKGAFEANPMDLFCVEVLRMFEPEFHSLLAESKLAIFGCNKRFMMQIFEDAGEHLKKWKASALNAAPVPKKECLSEMLDCLFPTQLEKSEDRRMRELRISESIFFDRYFQLALSRGDVEQAEVEELVASLSDRKAFSKKLIDLDKRRLASSALERLTAYSADFKRENTVSIAGALFDVGDRLPNCFDTGHNFELSQISYWIINSHLVSELNGDKRFAVLESAISSSEGIYLSAIQTEHERYRIANVESAKIGNMAQPIITRADLQKLQQLCSEKISNAAKDGRLKSNQYLRFIVECWSKWGNPGDVKSFFAELVETSPLLVLERFLDQAAGAASGGEFFNILFPPSLSELRSVIDLEEIDAALARIDSTQITIRQRNLLTSFKHLYNEYQAFERPH